MPNHQIRSFPGSSTCCANLSEQSLEDRNAAKKSELTIGALKTYHRPQTSCCELPVVPNHRIRPGPRAANFAYYASNHNVWKTRKLEQNEFAVGALTTHHRPRTSWGVQMTSGALTHDGACLQTDVHLCCVLLFVVHLQTTIHDLLFSMFIISSLLC